MKPTFPGMNPYLEDPDLWPEVHFGLISALARSLNPRLTPKYRAAVEKRVYSDALLVGIPDLSVFQTDRENSAATQTIPQTVQQPIKVTLPIPEEIREHYLEIRQVATGQVVTVIEVLSPKNKRVGEGRTQYNLKRQKVLSGLSHLVEIDLLRSGDPLPMAGNIQSDYRILVSRSGDRPEAMLYSFNLRDPIPLFTLPLLAEDPEPTVDLNALLTAVYDEAALDLVIDYSKPPHPPVTESDWQWIQHKSNEDAHTEI